MARRARRSTKTAEKPARSKNSSSDLLSLIFGTALILGGVGSLGYFARDFYERLFPSNAYYDFSQLSPATLQEWRLATADHEIVATVVASCSSIYNLKDQPDFVRAQLRLDTVPDGRRFPDRVLSSAEHKQPLLITNFQRAAIFLSDAIVRARAEAAGSAAENYKQMFWLQVVIIALGAITTILISLKSITLSPVSNVNARLSRTIGIVAIVFSSAATGFSTFNAFYAPRESYFKSERSLASLRQLHADLATRIASTSGNPKDACPQIDISKKDDAHAVLIQDWTARLGSIVNASETASSSPQSGAANNPADQQKNNSAVKVTH